jgi:poly(3-hydroxybutyrate) depolymerase
VDAGLYDPMRRTMARSIWKAVAVGAVLSGPMLCGASIAQEAPGAPLAALRKLDASAITVSGISSGAFFAHQFHVAYSGLVKGAGLVAGGPYGCADNADSITPPNPFEVALVPRRVVAALAVCTRFSTDDFKRDGWQFPAKPNARDSRATATREHAAGKIDDPANLADSRVWIFHGHVDDVVPQSAIQELTKFYQLMAVPAASIEVVDGADARHGMPIDALAHGGAGKHCEPPEPSFLVKCDYGAAELLLPHLYPGAVAPPAGAKGTGRIVAFDQTQFFDATDESASLDKTGYLYVPPDCENDSASVVTCRLHVAFHGCEQYAAKIHETFVREAGYNAWADANHLVVLYPQTTQWLRPLTDPAGFTANPKGCWDWWGYSGSAYLTRDGTQMKAVRAMIARLLSL